MAVMNLLRILVDVSFYGAFVGLVARACGGDGAILGMMIQGVCFGLSGLGGKRRVLRMVCLLPMALGWIINFNSLADCILLIPTAVYIIRLVWQGDYVLDGERQKRLFGVFWKVLAVVFVFGMLLGGAEALTAVTIPYGLIMLTCSVLLMRALRHEPNVYCGARYQVINLSTAAVVAGAAGLLGSKVFLNACTSGLKAVYRALLRPVLEFLLKLLMYVIEAVIKLLSLFPFQIKKPGLEEMPQVDVDGAKEIFDKEIQMKEPNELLRMIGVCVLVAAAVVGLILFFRWIGRRRDHSGAQIATGEQRDRLAAEPRTRKRNESSPVRKIRAQYRSFLKWCSDWNITMDRSSTSLDIHRQIGLVSEQEGLSHRIRQLYIKARYAGKAGRDDVKEMKQLCDQLKTGKKI